MHGDDILSTATCLWHACDIPERTSQPSNAVNPKPCLQITQYPGNQTAALIR